jgi:dipeptidyl aminopeptidase/acylaminoacyl peptidase
VPEAEVVRFPTTDGLMLEGRMVPPSIDRKRGDTAVKRYERLPDDKQRSVVLFCHGVADSDESLMATLFSDAGFRVFQFDYRGFGRSDAVPLTNRGLAADAVSALRYLRSRPDVDPDKVVIFGHSMGAGYALAAAASAAEAGNRVRAVIVAGGFSSWRRIANHYLPVLGFLFGGVQGPDPADYARRLGATPLLIAHAVNDEYVPIENAYRLFNAATRAGTPATLLLLPDGGHLIPFERSDLAKPIAEYAVYYLDNREWTRAQREAFRRGFWSFHPNAPPTPPSHAAPQ